MAKIKIKKQDSAKRVIPFEVVCSCGCDHLRSCIVDSEWVIRRDKCSCPAGTEHVAMLPKDKVLQ